MSQPYGGVVTRDSSAAHSVPRLHARLRASAIVAGCVSFVIASLGWIITLASTSMLAYVVLVLASGNPGGTREPLVVAFMIVMSLLPIGLGLAITGGGLLSSVGILARGGHPRAWTVTWLSFCIAAPVWALVTFGGVFAMSATRTAGSEDYVSVDGLLVTVFSVGLLTAAVIGPLSWWWMAHALRTRLTADTPAATAPLP